MTSVHGVSVMSMFGDGTNKEGIYQELRYIYEDKYGGDWDNSENKIEFMTDVLYVLHTMFGDW